MLYTSQNTSQIKKKLKSPLHKYLKKDCQDENMVQIYNQFLNADNKKKEKKNLLKIIDMCYQNLDNQTKLVQILQLPFITGPISLHQFPTILLQQNQVINRGIINNEQQTQLEFLFNFLKNMKEYYYCWIIYFNEDLKILNVKLLKKQQIKQNEDMFNPILNLIGIFINKNKIINKNINRQNTIYKLLPYNQKNNKNKIDQIHNKSFSTINNSTGTTWKKMMSLQKICQNEQNTKQQQKLSKFNKSTIQLIQDKKQLQYRKILEEKNILNHTKKYIKSYSIKHLKEKSKSQLLLNRCKSNIRQIIIDPIEKTKLIHNSKVVQQKKKLKKQSKVSKINSIYFKKVQDKINGTQFKLV